MSIKIKVLFFGSAADIAGKKDEEIKFSAGINSRTALENILTSHPGFTDKFAKSLLFAVNQEYATGDEILNEGDELALIPPVSGG